MDNSPGALLDWETVIQAAWPEVTATAVAQDLEKYSWQELIGAGQLVAPFAVIVEPESHQSPDFGTDNLWWESDVTFFYVMADHSQADPVMFLKGRQNTMEAALLSGLGLTTIQVIPEGWGRSTGPENPMNQVLNGQKLPFTAASITWRCLVPGSNVGP